MEIKEAQYEAVEPQSEAKAGLQPERPQRTNTPDSVLAPAKVIVDHKSCSYPDQSTKRAYHRQDDTLGPDWTIIPTPNHNYIAKNEGDGKDKDKSTSEVI